MALAQVFSCELCKIFKSTYFIEHLRWLLLILEYFYYSLIKILTIDQYNFDDLDGLISFAENLKWNFV